MNLSEARTALPTAWVEALQKVLETMTATAPAVDWQELDGAPPAEHEGEPLVWWADGVSLRPQPSLWMGATADGWKSLGSWILATLGVDEAGDEDIQSTCRDVVAQVASAFATELAKQLGTPLNSLGANPAEKPPRDVFAAALDLARPHTSQKTPFVIAFHSSLGGDEPEQAQAPEPEPESAAADAPVFAEPIAELRFPVYARLGVTQVQLGDVFKWTVGSIVEIDRRVTDPIDVVIGGRLVARGQVVVANAHYGARVTAIERSHDGELSR